MSITSLTDTSTTTTESSSSLASLTEDFDAFLSLLTTQLQNQDPQSPMDSNEMTNQLVQFASVEQQIKQTDNLEALIALQQTSADAAAVSFIGKEISFDGAQTHIDGNGTEVTWTYSLPTQAATSTLNIVSETGSVVASIPGETIVGAHAITWDGRDAEGNLFPAGTYELRVDAVDEDSVPLDVAFEATGVVTSIASGTDGPSIFLGGIPLTLDQIRTFSAAPASTGT